MCVENGEVPSIDDDRLQMKQQQEGEASLLCAQHASKILITVIQNSPLDSPMMEFLSSNSALSQIMDLIIILSSGDDEQTKTNPVLVAHKSIMT